MFWGNCSPPFIPDRPAFPPDIMEPAVPWSFRQGESWRRRRSWRWRLGDADGERGIAALRRDGRVSAEVDAVFRAPFTLPDILMAVLPGRTTRRTGAWHEVPAVSDALRGVDASTWKATRRDLSVRDPERHQWNGDTVLDAIRDITEMDASRAAAYGILDHAWTPERLQNAEREAPAGP